MQGHKAVSGNEQAHKKRVGWGLSRRVSELLKLEVSRVTYQCSGIARTIHRLSSSQGKASWSTQTGKC